MAALALLNAEILAGPLRLTAHANEVKLDLRADALDTTVFASGGSKTLISGLHDSTVEASGLWDATPAEAGALAPDAQLWAELGGAQLPATVCPFGTDLDVAYIVPTKRGEITMFGKVGDLAPFGSTMWGDGAPARGQLIHPANVIRTAGGTGSTSILGTVPTGRSLLVAIHVLAIAGTSPVLGITVQRDDNSGFAYPVGVTASTGNTSPGSSLFVAPGPITPDDRYRVVWTLTGTTPTARFAVAVGIA